jgi:hypothetical protein
MRMRNTNSGTPNHDARCTFPICFESHVVPVDKANDLRPPYRNANRARSRCWPRRQDPKPVISLRVKRDRRHLSIRDVERFSQRIVEEKKRDIGEVFAFFDELIETCVHASPKAGMQIGKLKHVTC